MKDILDFLISDHERIRGELSTIKNEPSLSARKMKMRGLFRDLYQHEQIEAKLFKELDDHFKGDAARTLIEDYQKLKDTLWFLHDLNMEAFDTGIYVVIDRSFNDLDAIIRIHMMSEEEVIFPRIRRDIPEEQLKKLKINSEILNEIHAI